MDPVSAIGLASSILTFIDIGYKVVTGTLEIAQTGRAPHTKHIDAVAHDLENAVAKFGQPVSPSASDPEKALGEISIRCKTLLTELLALLERFKVPTAQPGISRDKLKVVIRRMRDDSKVQELQKSLAEYRSQILVHLVTILNDRQLATQVQLGNAFGEARTDLRGIRDAINHVRTEILDKFEQVLKDEPATIQPISGTREPLLGQDALLDEFAIQFQEVKDALDRLESHRSGKTPETRIMEQVYFGNSMFQREETLKPADKTTFQWFVHGVPNEDVGDSVSVNLQRMDREETPGVLRNRALKAKVASAFEKWLRSGRGVFHISGKAGSGKSTLMKLVLSTKRTHELLREWAGDKRLLSARFYFWAGGDQMQNSLEGLQRSILFEILIQRPDLVKQVFREAYSTVVHSSWESPIHSRFFTKASFQQAFDQLLRLPADGRYRLCICIDGLDEYGADVTLGSLPETERENLAQNLVEWTSNDHVKVLASSRPYPEFNDNFAEDQRVHLHQLTHDDMIELGHHLFERHRVFRFPGVKERYHDLVQKVVYASGGVFLWTGLTIQRLLASLARHDSFESLQKQLEATPRDLNVLYDRMFSEIDKHDRHEAMKMMLLVSEQRKYLGTLSHPRGVNAMAFGWLEALEDPEFPANQPFVVYTEDEIEERRKFAESRVNGYTRGLLEVTTYTAEPESHEQLPLHLRHTVQFFHRTALDYVAASFLARDVLSSSPNLFNLEFYTRLSLAELHVGSLCGRRRLVWDDIERYRGILGTYFNTPNPCRSLIEAYRAAFEQQTKYSAWWAAMISFNATERPICKVQGRDQSIAFDHWVANEVQGTYATQYLAESFRTLHDTRQREGLSLLLSAACFHGPKHHNTFTRIGRVKMLLGLGADLCHGIRLRVTGMGHKWPITEFSVWQVWCLYYVTITLSTWKIPWQTQKDNLDMNQILELFLETGVDSDCYILLRDEPLESPETLIEQSDHEISEDSESGMESKSNERAQQWIIDQPYADLWDPADRWRRPGVYSGIKRHRSKTAYAISLRDFILQTNKPANYEQLHRLLGKNNHRQNFSPIELSEIGAELATSKHVEFSNPTVRPLDMNQFFASHSREQLMAYWIRWKDVTIPGFVELRLY